MLCISYALELTISTYCTLWRWVLQNWLLLSIKPINSMFHVHHSCFQLSHPVWGHEQFNTQTESSPTMYFYDKTRKYFPRKSGWIVCVCVFCCFSFILIFLLSFPPGRHSSITLKFTLGVLVLKLIIKQHDFLK